MNVRQKARRSDALHYDYISRRDLCNMIANLESDLEDEKADNAKLRRLVSKIHYHYKGVMLEGMTFLGQAEIDEYEAEMRELGLEVDNK